ncbi:MAG: hypothetical protein FJ278_15045 [Planctomycetes bacterium]|nr:hypothetical protein [Planctomycetota bacterium]
MQPRRLRHTRDVLMAIKVRFPKVDANVLEGQVGKWLKKEGDAIAKGEPLVELITDKANFELPAEAAGTLRKILSHEKSVIPVGYVMAILGDGAEEMPDVTAENEALLVKHRELAALGKLPSRVVKPLAEKKARVRATPAARRIAKEAGIDLADVPLSDANQIVTEEVVQQFLAGRGKQ